jgi:hypothetical protein
MAATADFELMSLFEAKEGTVCRIVTSRGGAERKMVFKLAEYI